MGRNVSSVRSRPHQSCISVAVMIIFSSPWNSLCPAGDFIVLNSLTSCLCVCVCVCVPTCSLMLLMPSGPSRFTACLTRSVLPQLSILKPRSCRNLASVEAASSFLVAQKQSSALRTEIRLMTSVGHRVLLNISNI